MPHAHLGEYELTLAGQTRRFRFSMLEAYKLDSILAAKKMPSVMHLSGETLSVPVLVDVLLVGLRAYEPALKLETVADWLTQDHKGFVAASQTAMGAVSQLFNGHNPLLVKEEEANPAPLDAGGAGPTLTPSAPNDTAAMPSTGATS